MAGKPKAGPRSWRGLPLDENGMDWEDRRDAREREKREAKARAEGINPKTGKPFAQDRL